MRPGQAAVFARAISWLATAAMMDLWSRFASRARARGVAAARRRWSDATARESDDRRLGRGVASGASASSFCAGAARETTAATKESAVAAAAAFRRRAAAATLAARDARAGVGSARAAEARMLAWSWAISPAVSRGSMDTGLLGVHLWPGPPSNRASASRARLLPRPSLRALRTPAASRTQFDAVAATH